MYVFLSARDLWSEYFTKWFGRTHASFQITHHHQVTRSHTSVNLVSFRLMANNKNAGLRHKWICLDHTSNFLGKLYAIIICVNAENSSTQKCVPKIYRIRKNPMRLDIDIDSWFQTEFGQVYVHLENLLRQGDEEFHTWNKVIELRTSYRRTFCLNVRIRIFYACFIGG